MGTEHAFHSEITTLSDMMEISVLTKEACFLIHLHASVTLPVVYRAFALSQKRKNK